MRLIRSSLLVAIIAAGSARADLVDAAACSSHLSVVTAVAAPAAPVHSPAEVASIVGLLDVSTSIEPSAVFAVRSTVAPSPVVEPASGPREPADSAEPAADSSIAPPTPGGDALCLSGVLSLSVVQLVRRAKAIRVDVPEWYHLDATGFFPDELSSPVSSTQIALLCSEPLSLNPPAPERWVAWAESVFPPSCVPRVASPRAPPIAA